MSLKEVIQIGENDHGYSFYVGKLGNRWVGVAASERGMFFLPGISEDYHLGIQDRERAIRMTGAVAQSPEHGYGGIERWFVVEELRGRPEDFRCVECGEIGCVGEHF